MNTLIMMVGLPRSGKSTYCHNRRSVPIVSPDCIRKAIHGQRYVKELEPEVWKTAHLMVVALFEAGHDRVFLDCCNVAITSRDDWADERWVREFVQFHTSKETCIRRAEENDQDYLIPVIEKMDATYTPISDDEIRSWER